MSSPINDSAGPQPPISSQSWKRRYASSLTQLPFLKGVLQVSGGTAAGQLVVVLGAPALARVYSPSQFGVYGFYTGVLSVLSVCAGLRYDSAIPIAHRRSDAVRLFVLSLLAALSTVSLLTAGTVATLLVPGFVPPGNPLREALPYLAPAVIAAAGFQALSNWGVRQRSYRVLSGSRLLQQTVQVSAQLLFGKAIPGGHGLELGDAIGRFAAASPKRFRLTVRELLAACNVDRLWKAARTYSSFPRIMLGAAFLNASAVQAPILLIPSLFGSAAAGSFFLAHRLLVLPASVIGAAVAQVLLGEAAVARTNRDQFSELCRKTTLALLSINAPIYLIAAVASKSLFAKLFGPAWAEAGAVAGVLAPSMLVWSIAGPLSPLLIVGDRLRESLAFTAIELVVKLVAIWLGKQSESLFVAAVSLSVGVGILSIFSIRRFLAVAGVGYRHIWKDATRIVLEAGIPTAVCVLSVRSLPISIAAGLSAVAVLSYWVRAFRRLSKGF